MRFVTLVGAFVFIAALSMLNAQDDYFRGFAAKGYITRLDPPSGFYINKDHIELTPATTFTQYLGSNQSTSVSDQVNFTLGSRVVVFGQGHGKHNYRADRVVIEEQEENKAAGSGAILSIEQKNGDATVEAGGYRIHITPATKTKFTEPLQSLSDVKPNTWVNFEGKVDGQGELSTTQIHFEPAKSAHIHALKGFEVWQLHMYSNTSVKFSTDNDQKMVQPDESEAPDDLHFAMSVHKYPLDKDKELQAKIVAIGRKLIPPAIAALPATDDSVPHFRFYVVDAPKLRSFQSYPNGITLISRQALDRLKNDDQIASILAQSIASILERVLMRLVSLQRKDILLLGGGDTLGAFIPGASLIGVAAEASLNSANSPTAYYLEQGRTGLQLMNKAGYKIAEAPDACRLISVKKVESDLSKIKYDDFCGYLLNSIGKYYPGVADTMTYAPNVEGIAK